MYLPYLDSLPADDWLSDHWSLIAARDRWVDEKDNLRPYYRTFVRQLLELDGTTCRKTWSDDLIFMKRVRALDVAVKYFESDLYQNWLINDFRDVLIDFASKSFPSSTVSDGERKDQKREVAISIRSAYRALRWVIDWHLRSCRRVSPAEGGLKTSLRQKVLRLAYIRTRIKARSHPAPAAAHDQIMSFALNTGVSPPDRAAASRRPGRSTMGRIQHPVTRHYNATPFRPPVGRNLRNSAGSGAAHRDDVGRIPIGPPPPRGTMLGRCERIFGGGRAAGRPIRNSSAPQVVHQLPLDRRTGRS